MSHKADDLSEFDVCFRGNGVKLEGNNNTAKAGTLFKILPTHSSAAIRRLWL